jgi:3-methyladenine DNA glycosylase AlkD
MLTDIKSEISKLADSKKAILLQKYFKTGKGEYAQGDIFIGLTVPQSRLIAKKYSDLSLEDIEILLHSKIHEERLIALLIMIFKFKRADDNIKKQIYNLYLSNTKCINNWDLVDLSSRDIVGAYLFDKPRDQLYKLAKSDNLWERRISIISTFYFIARKEYKESIKIANILLNDSHDLIHKAVGWTLREVGKKDKDELIRFLKEHYKVMPRTMLRYAIEKFPLQKRKAYLASKI